MPTTFLNRGYKGYDWLQMVTRVVTDLSLTTDSFPKSRLQGLRGLQTIHSILTAFINGGYKGYDWLQMVMRVTDQSVTNDSFQKSGLQGLQTIHSILTAFINGVYKVTIGYKWLHGLQTFL
jgi:hypothetical protein